MGNDPEEIAFWQRLNAQTTTSGRLVTADVERLAALGVRHVINLAPADHPLALPEEAALLQARAIAYSHVPVPFAAPGTSHFAAFCAALEGGERPVHVHCIMNWRVSAFFYRWHLDVAGMAEPEARALMEQQWRPESADHADAPAWARFCDPA